MESALCWDMRLNEEAPRSPRALILLLPHGTHPLNCTAGSTMPACMHGPTLTARMPACLLAAGMQVLGDEHTITLNTAGNLGYTHAERALKYLNKWAVCLISSAPAANQTVS